MRLGSLTYASGSSGLQLEAANFAGGTIRVSGASQEINYFLTDHLGSVRAIVDANGNVKERNDYYAFGAKHVRSDYPQYTNRYDYNGKEEQTTGDLKFLDYGFRMYDNALGRWFNVDLLAEMTTDISPYAYCYNNPINFIDMFGLSGQSPEKTPVPIRMDPVYVWGKSPSQSLWQYLMMMYGGQNNSNLPSIAELEEFGKNLAEVERSLSQLDTRSWLRRTLDDYAPMWSFSVLSDQAWNRGEYFNSVLYFVAGVADGFTLGRVGAFAKIATKQGAKMVSTSVAKGGINGAKSVGAAVKGFSKESFKAVDKKFLKQHGINNIHEFKEEFLGKNVPISNFDVVKNTQSGELLIIKQSTREIVEYTGIIIK